MIPRAFAVLLTAGLAWLYAPVARGLAVQWVTSPDASYGLILAAAAVGLTWRHRGLVQPTTDAGERPSFIDSASGLLPLCGGLLLYLAGVFAADLFATRASLVAVAGGLLWFLYGRRRARVFLAPLALLLLAIPLPELVVNALTLPLQLAASGIAEMVLAAARVPVFRDGNVIEVPSITLQVAEACNGLRSAVSLTCVAGLLAWSGGGSIARRGAVVGSAPPIAVLVNGLRVAATAIACEYWSREAARGAWHTLTGWVTFVLAVVLLLVVWRLAYRPERPALEPAEARA